MNTKTFAQLARTNLIKGVENKLNYWGFDKKGNITESPEKIEGGYLFRGEAYDDVNALTLWNSLKSAIGKKGIDVVKEEAAYTWFNRMMAICILAKNNYEQPQLEYAEGMMLTPIMLQRARQGYYDFLSVDEQRRLKNILPDYSQDQASFTILLIGYCHSHTLLKNIFGGIDDYTELLLPDNMLSENGFLHLLNTTDAISDEQYREVELIGWLYQFYISDRKDEVFASFKKNKKAEAKDIPAATQIFTPNWIVKYMVQNTVGKLWLDLHPDSPIRLAMKYLVEGKSPEYGNPIIMEVANIKLLDPACGSGHILVEGFDLLYQMYMAEYYTAEEAVESIFKNNLFGLDIDKRAAQLSRFAVYLKAAKQYPGVLKKGWMLHIYAMPEPVDFSRQELLDFLGNEGIEYEEPLSKALLLMKDAQNLGSIMQFDLTSDALNFLSKQLPELQQKTYKTINEELAFTKLKAYIEVLLVLTKKYEAVVANPPYMGSGNMNESLKSYINSKYPISKSDLFAVFMEVCLNLNVRNGLMGMINMHSWMFLSSYESLRKHIINNYSILSMLHLGPRTFEELSGEVVQSTTFVLENGKNIKTATYYRLVDFKKVHLKEYNFLQRNNKHSNIPQSNFSKIPGGPIAYWVSNKVVELFEMSNSLGNKILTKVGLDTSDNDNFILFWYEINYNLIGFGFDSKEIFWQNSKKWIPHTKGGTFRKWYGNLDVVLRFDKSSFEVLSKIGNKLPSRNFYFREGINWSRISSAKISLRLTPKGTVFNSACPTAFANTFDLNYAMGFLNSKLSSIFITALNPTINFQAGTINKLPFIISDNLNIENKVNQCVNLSKSDWNSRETSWNFQQSPLLNKNINLEQSYHGYLHKISSDFFQLNSLEEELNRIFIEIYELQDELMPDVALKDITILQNELESKALEKLESAFRKGKTIKLPIKQPVVMQQLISYALGVFMGRYRLDQPGLHIAHPNPTKEEIASYEYNGHTVEIDEDAIIPLMGSACDFADDAVTRFKDFLDVVWGEDTRIENINFLQECLDQDLEKFIVNGFWKTHCSMYKKKPIYWLFASPKGAFQVLVYMHRMNAFTVEMIRANYLINHLKTLRSKIAIFEKSESSLSAQDSKMLDKLRKDLLECEQYDLVLKTVADNQIPFDLDDGVTANYKLFEGVVAEIK